MDTIKIINENPKTVKELYDELALIIAAKHGDKTWEAYGGDLEVVDKENNTIAIFHEP